MPEHRIRFRAGWELSTTGGDPAESQRVTLPIVWSPGMVGSIRLSRRFGRPPIDPSVESIWLELLGVPGLRSLDLNGHDLGPIPPDVLDWTVPLSEILEPRNVLTIELVTGQPTDGWGSIALLIAPKSRDADLK